jgi:hypothetical protein
VTTPVPVAPDPPVPGYATSEFWLTTLGMIASFALALLAIFHVKVNTVQVNTALAAAAPLAALLGAAFYSNSRAKVKAAHLSAIATFNSSLAIHAISVPSELLTATAISSSPAIDISEQSLNRFDTVVSFFGNYVNKHVAALEKVAESTAALVAHDINTVIAEAKPLVVEAEALVKTFTGNAATTTPAALFDQDATAWHVHYASGFAPHEKVQLPGRRLGKAPVQVDPRTLKLSTYLTDTTVLPKMAAGFDWSSLVKKWPMYLNDTLGDCTIAETGHQIQLWSAAARDPEEITDAQVLKAYEAISGYNPQTGADDNGAVILDVLKYWRKTGIGAHTIAAFLQIDPTSFHEMTLGNYLFGGLDLGLQMPLSAQNLGTSWDMPPGTEWQQDPNWVPGSWGGHCVYALSVDRKGDLKVISWGEVITVSAAFVTAYVDEAYVAVSVDFMRAGKSPAGFDLAQLTSDLAAV